MGDKKISCGLVKKWALLEVLVSKQKLDPSWDIR